MTDDLVQLWRDGDPMAATAVRNALRGIADAVLTSPTGQPGGAVALADADRRRDATAAVAKEVMQRGGSSADELRGLAVMVSARHAVVEARAGDPASGVDSHLPPQLVVSVALAPDSLSSHARGVAERHLHDCPSCTGEVDLVLRVVKGLTMPRPVAPAGTAAAASGTAAAAAGTAAASAGTAAA
ncbi:hypothetical protein L6R53_32280, partial [Myxococcota bacterium]|nr:hypothetical protein [Myxococcota bacterium]